MDMLSRVSVLLLLHFTRIARVIEAGKTSICQYTGYGLLGDQVIR